MKTFYLSVKITLPIHFISIISFNFASSQIIFDRKTRYCREKIRTTHNFHAFDVTHDAKIWQTSTIKISPVKSHKHMYTLHQLFKTN